MTLDTRLLFAKLDDTTRRALEAAAGLALSRSHYEVGLEHWLIKLCEPTDADLARVIAHFGLDPGRLVRDLERSLEAYKTGNSRRPDLTDTVAELARDAWSFCSVNYGSARIRSAGILLAALAEVSLRRRLIDIHADFARVSVEELTRELLRIVAGSREDREVGAAAATPATHARPGDARARQTPALDQYTLDLTAEAQAGRIDPVLGRDAEIRQIVDILLRRRQNNPILTGEAGVGKTAVVEGFALRVASDDVPDALRGVALRTLDLGLLQAGAGVKGEFENRLKQVIEEVRSSPRPIILFVDEAHTLIGAGGQEGQNDAANLLKPALARGELRTIAATTWTEYKKYFERDPALARRFQAVKVEEPGEPAAIGMMRGLAPRLEAHHRVRILDEAIVESVRLSHRYIPARQLPDKSVSVLDTAAARIARGRRATPAPLEDARRRIEALEAERAILARQHASEPRHGERLDAIAGETRAAATELEQLEQRWQREKELVEQIAALRSELETADPAAADDDARRARLDALRSELREAQGEAALVSVDVDAQAIADVISGWTGIPVGKMLADEIHSVLALEARLGERVLGQDHALAAIAKRIHTARANLDDPRRPQGVFLLAGPSGVGKTETALALADAIYGGERNAIVLNMSEYQEGHTVSTLKGAPPGYVGYGEGGVLTEAVRRRPYSVVLLDEVEKAHPDVLEIFFQVFDKGVLEDGQGREIDFKNTVILLTSNVGAERLAALCDRQPPPDPEALGRALRPDLLRAFPAALLGRLVTVPFYPIAPAILRRIIRLQLDRIARRLSANHGAKLAYGEELIDAVQARCVERESGARAVDHILTHSLLPQIAADVLARMARAEAFAEIQVGIDAAGEFAISVH